MSSPSLVMERSKAVICRNLFNDQSELLRIDRFDLVRTLGSGGMGVVYEAIDPQRDEHVALKMLKERGVGELYRLKREFRSLWITRINAAVRELGMSYSVFMAGLRKANIDIDRKVLADLAVMDKPAFAKIAGQVKASLAH